MNHNYHNGTRLDLLVRCALFHVVQFAVDTSLVSRVYRSGCEEWQEAMTQLDSQPQLYTTRQDVVSLRAHVCILEDFAKGNSIIVLRCVRSVHILQALTTRAHVHSGPNPQPVPTTV